MTPAPEPLPFGVNMLGPVLIAFGSEEQKKHFLPRIANLDDWWCQGFSEPGAGSDLASLQDLRRKRDGDHYVVNGQKIWTTLRAARRLDLLPGAHRPDGKKQEGITFLLIDMKTPGVDRAPDHHDRRRARSQRGVLRQRARAGREPGRRGEQGLELRQVPARQRAQRHRARRRCPRRASGALKAARRDRALRRQAADRRRPLPRASSPRSRSSCKALEITQLRVSSPSATRDGNKPDPESRCSRSRASEIQQAHHRAAARSGRARTRCPISPHDESERWNEPPIGPEWAGPLAPQYFNYRKASIYGGSNEIQKNIIAKAILGL